ncbi:MAG: Spy/CpxP family protein refolding chaperone [Syntrophobacteraceae bacterium]|nr:Spy/CpxP family protein refolding chaperone [Syntrophobacteraceae bacterium]
MKKIFIGFCIALVATVWMSGSSIFFNSIARSAEGVGAQAIAGEGCFCRHHGGHWRHHHHFWKMLDLTDNQKKEMFSIKLEERAKMKPLFQSLKTAREQLVALVKSGKFDEAKAKEIAKGQAAVLSDIIVDVARMHARMYAVLTPEQRAKLDKMHEQWKSRHEMEHQKKH